jgi:hypothetical protein
LEVVEVFSRLRAFVRQANRGAPRRIYTTWLTILLLCSAFINVLLAREVINLRRAISFIKAELRGRQEYLQIGESIPPIPVQTLSTTHTTLDLPNSQKPTILYIFLPGCELCDRNAANVSALTLLVSPNGTLLKNWFGAYTGGLKLDLERNLNVTLPGVLSTG